MSTATLISMDLPSAAHDFYRHALELMTEGRVPVLVGGAFALAWHTGVRRFTKDFDLFLRPEDRDRALGLLEGAGYRTEQTFPHWLAKVFHRDFFVDLIYSSGNGLCRVDEGWFRHAPAAEVLGVSVGLVPAEELIWSKAFVQERERFDGADIAHILRAEGPRLDWRRLLGRFGPHWRVLFAHLILFGFVYPAGREVVPAGVLEDLGRRWRQDLDGPRPAAPVCQGTLLSREQYLVDLREWGYADARAAPHGVLGPEDIARWTEAIEPK
jgi:hypothetical protein